MRLARFIFSLAVGWLLSSASLRAQSRVDWGVFGGATTLSSGGVYTVEGTAGQASTALARGGRYGLTTGFWTFQQSPAP